MKKIIPIFLLLLIAGLAIYFLLENRNPEKPPSDTFILPEVEVSSIRIKSFEGHAIRMEMISLIDNKMPLSFQLDSLRYRIEMEDIRVMESTYRDSIYIEASDSSRISLPLLFYTDRYASVIQKAEQEQLDSVLVQVQSTFYTDLPLVEGPFDASFNRKIPLIRQPKIQIEQMNVEKLGLDQSEVTIRVKFINPNQVALKIRNTAYLLEVGDDEVVSGDIRKVTNIPADDTTTFVVPARVNIDQIGETAFDLLFNPGTTDYYFRISSTMESKMDIINNSRFRLINRGKLNEVIN
jgi:LEA14-like dessication related protein